MRAVGKAAEKMVEAVSEDFLELQYRKKSDLVKKPNKEKFIEISTEESINQMFLPGLIVLI